MLVVNRFADPGDSLRTDLEAAVAVLARQQGFRSGELGRNLDDPSLWVLVTRWDDVGSYRRALSAYDVKLSVVPILSRALDEPSAYEQVVPGATLNEADTRRR
jgi:hypothetical protein